MPTVKTLSIGLALTISIIGIARPGLAQIDKCQGALAKNSQKFETQIAKGLEKCLASIRKSIVKGKPASDGAYSCEKTIDKLLGLGVVAPAKSKVGKFLAAIEKLETSGQCTAAELTQLGHLVSGVNAPGTGTTDFVASWMAVVKQKMAWTEHVFDNGDARDLIDLALSAGPAFDDPAECDPGNGKGCGTNCSGIAPSGYINRPNLCNLSPKSWPDCHIAACHLKTTGAVLQPSGVPINLTNSKFALDICRVPSSTLPVNTSNFVFLAANSMRTFNPPPTVPYVPAVTWCIDQVRAEGWCDCTGQAIPFSPQSCLDHDADVGGSCPPDGATLEDDCVCTSPPGPSCGGTCTKCLNAETGAPCHPGTMTSEVTTTYTGASAANDCLYLSTMQFRFLAPATCVNAAGKPLGPCKTVGAATPTCAGLGGTSCVSSLGTDGLACTHDDVTSSDASVTIPFTTGTAGSTIESFVDQEGICLAPASHFNMNCTTDADCDSTAGGDGDCDSVLSGCMTGPNPGDCRFTTAAGAGLSCARLESGNLSNFVLTGTLPALDAAPGVLDALPMNVSAGLDDHIITFRLDCN